MRKTIDIAVTAEGRDKGKVFHLTEMPAMQAESWAGRALIAMAKGGVDLPEGMTVAGMAGLAAAGIRNMGNIAWADAEPLLAEMLRCVSFVPNPDRPDIVRRLNPDGSDIEEVPTLLQLRMELLKLHMDFSRSAAPSISTAAPSNT